jgi:nucleotide-binding universal stress UspA family protein
MNSAFKHLLVAIDGSEFSGRAIQLALDVSRGARITALMVVHDYGLTEYLRAALGGNPHALDLRREIVADGYKRLAFAISRVRQAVPHVSQLVVLSDQSPFHEILATAEREGCDLIVVAPHGHGGLSTLLLGSQTQRVLAGATVPVLVAR